MTLKRPPVFLRPQTHSKFWKGDCCRRHGPHPGPVLTFLVTGLGVGECVCGMSRMRHGCSISILFFGWWKFSFAAFHEVRSLASKESFSSMEEIQKVMKANPSSPTSLPSPLEGHLEAWSLCSHLGTTTGSFTVIQRSLSKAPRLLSYWTSSSSLCMNFLSI